MTTTNHKRSFTHVSPLTGSITIRYYHECIAGRNIQAVVSGDSVDGVHTVVRR